MAIEYLGLSSINGPLVVLEGVENAFYDEIVEFIVDHDTRKMGRIVELDEDKAVIQVFEGTEICRWIIPTRGLRDIRWKLPCHRKCWAVHLTGSGKQSMALDRSQMLRSGM